MPLLDAGQDEKVANAMSTFTAQLDAFVRKTKQKADYVFKESTMRVTEEMQKPVGAGGNMPIDTGFLRASLMASTAAMPSLLYDNPGGAIRGGALGAHDNEVTLAILGAELGDTIYLGYTANYAGYVNYGAQGRPPRQFVDRAAQQWESIVAGVCSEVKNA